MTHCVLLLPVSTPPRQQHVWCSTNPRAIYLPGQVLFLRMLSSKRKSREKKRAKRGRSDLFLSNLIPMFRWLVFSANFSFREARPASIAPWIVRAAQTCRAGRNHCQNEETIGTLLVVTRHYYCGAYSCFSFLIFLPL